MNLISLSLDTVFAGLLIFCRLGTIIMFLPGLSDPGIAVRIRLIFAVVVSVIVIPVLSGNIPAAVDSDLRLLLIIASEVTTGLSIGISIRMLFNIMQTIGAIISMSTGLAAAMMFDPMQGTQSSIYGRFFSTIAVLLFLVTDLHSIVFKAMVESYTVFPFNSFGKYYDDYIRMIIRVGSDVFILAVKMSSPFIIIAMVINVGAGILSRLMPQFQMFFLILPVQIVSGFFIASLVLSGVMMWFLGYVEQHLIDIYS